MKILNLLSKIRIILLSRIKKPKTEGWIEDRRAICNICPHNTKNLNSVSIKQKIVRLFSNVLTFIMTLKLNEDDSECSLCTCTLYYKIKEESETCLDNRWKSIYIPNSAKKQKIY